MGDSVVVIAVDEVLIVGVVGLHAPFLDLEEVELVFLAPNRRAIVALPPIAVILVLSLETRTQCHLKSLQAACLLAFICVELFNS